jgi:hypothetical protein
VQVQHGAASATADWVACGGGSVAPQARQVQTKHIDVGLYMRKRKQSEHNGDAGAQRPLINTPTINTLAALTPDLLFFSFLPLGFDAAFLRLAIMPSRRSSSLNDSSSEPDSALATDCQRAETKEG